MTLMREWVQQIGHLLGGREIQGCGPYRSHGKGNEVLVVSSEDDTVTIAEQKARQNAAK